MDAMIGLFSDPAGLGGIATLVIMEVVLGIDNLIFISILSNKLPEAQRQSAPDRHRPGSGDAAGVAVDDRLARRALPHRSSTWNSGSPVPYGEPTFETQFSWRDLILIVGGLFLVWKATKEIHHNVDPHPNDDMLDVGRKTLTFASAIGQILLLDAIFSVDLILTAVGMTDHLPVMVIAVVVAVLLMLFAADPLANFIHNNPTVVMLALGFLLMIGSR